MLNSINHLRMYWANFPNLLFSSCVDMKESVHSSQLTAPEGCCQNLWDLYFQHTWKYKIYNICFLQAKAAMTACIFPNKKTADLSTSSIV